MVLGRRRSTLAPVLDTSNPLHRLVQQLLLAQLEGLEAPQVAAFVQGWLTALELVRRTDVVIPDATVDAKAAVAEVVRRIERAQEVVLGDDDED